MQSHRQFRKRVITVVDVQEEENCDYTGDLERLNVTDVNEARDIMQKALKLYFHAEKATRDVNKCTLCNAPATKACAVCRTDYCSEECQYKDWPLHQRLCDQLAKESIPQNQNNPPLNQNQQAIMPALERSKDNQNINHNFGRRRDPRTQRGFRGGHQQGPQRGFQHNSTQNPPQFEARRNQVEQEPLNTYADTSRNFPPPPVDIPQGHRQYNRTRTHPRPPNPSDIDDTIERLDPRLSNRYQSNREPAQNVARGGNSQQHLEHQQRPNENVTNNFSNELFARRPDPRIAARSNLLPPVNDPNPNIFIGQPESHNGGNRMLPRDDMRRDFSTDNRFENIREPLADNRFQGRREPPTDNRYGNDVIREFPVQDPPAEDRRFQDPCGGGRTFQDPAVDNRRFQNNQIQSGRMENSVERRGPSCDNRRFSGPSVDNRRLENTSERRGPPYDNRRFSEPLTENRRIENIVESQVPPYDNTRFSRPSTDNRITESAIENQGYDNRRFPRPSMENRRMPFPLNNRKLQEFPTENRAPNPSVVTDRRLSGPPRENDRIPDSHQIVNREIQDNDSRFRGTSLGNRTNFSRADNLRRHDSPMDVEPVESPVRIVPQNEIPKIRVKSLDTLKEAPAPKPPTEKVTTKLSRALDQPFSSIFGHSNEEVMEGLSDVEDYNDLDDIEMDTGPERVNVIGLTREDSDKYWVIREINYTLWETMQEDVKKCARNRTIRPAVNVIGACLYEDEWYRGKVIRVRPIMKVHFIDYGNTETYTGEIKELPVELAQVEPLAFLIQFGENTPLKYLTKDLDGRKFEVEITESLEDGIKLVRIPQQERKTKKPEVIYTVPNFTKKHPVILCGYSVNEVYVRPIDDNSAKNFEKLQNDINEHVAAENALKYPPVVGEMVCARCDINHTYYRARVLFVGGGDLIRVNFVDYGEEQETLLQYLKPISEELKSRPDYILKLKLSGVPNHPPPPEVITYFNRLVTSKAKLIMNYEDNTEGVILEEEVTGIVINDHVTRMILDKIKQSELLLENSLKFINLTTGNIKKLSISFIDKEEFFKSTVFYVIDPQHESYELVTETLATEISVYCNKEPTGFTPELKELCLAKFDDDWYRGINLECLDDDREFRIFFIDYGNESVVHRSCIRRMPRKFSEAPCMAIRATIADSKKLINRPKLNDEIFEYLESNVSRSISNVEVIEVIDDGLTSLTTLKFPEIDRVLVNI